MKNKSIAGITLITLVITIIILLILAGITLGTLTGENGLFARAKQAQKEAKKAQYFEEINLEILDEQTERFAEAKGEAFIKSLQERMEKKDWVKNILMCKETENGMENETIPERANILIVETKEGYEIIIEVNNGEITAKIRDYFEKVEKNNKCTIKYNKNGGTGEELEEQEIRKGFSIKLRENTYTKTDYKFVGWCENKEGEGEIYQGGSYYTASKNTTLYAIWRERTVTVTFNENAGTDTVTGQMESVTVAEGKNTKLPISTLEREGYYFKDWNTKADGTGEKYENGTNININKDTILYAQWLEKIKTITVNDLTIIKGKSGQLEVTKTPNNTFVEGVTYTSSNSGIATVDRDGKVTGIARGTVTITVAGEITTNIKNTCTVTVQPSGIEACDVAKLPTTYYGAEVTGYNAGTGVSKWRIFYADNSNIYLIADDYISKNDAPKTTSGKAMQPVTDYILNFSNVYNDYSGSKWIIENSKAKNWIKRIS